MCSTWTPWEDEATYSESMRMGILMTAEDEAAYSSLLVEADPTVRLVDGDRWPSAAPPTRNSISECSSPFVYVWSRRLTPSIAARRRDDGLFVGPQAGEVLQIERAIHIGDEIRSGSIAFAGREDLAVALELSDLARKALRMAAPIRVETVAGAAMPQYRVGRHAADWYFADPGPVWSRQNPGRRLRDRTVEVYLRPTVGPASARRSE